MLYSRSLSILYIVVCIYSFSSILSFFLEKLLEGVLLRGGPHCHLSFAFFSGVFCFLFLLLHSLDL